MPQDLMGISRLYVKSLKEKEVKAILAPSASMRSTSRSPMVMIPNSDVLKFSQPFCQAGRPNGLFSLLKGEEGRWREG